MNYKKLQNGSDIRGVAIRVPGEELNLTAKVAERIIAAYTQWLSDKTGLATNELKICVGRDSRLTGEALADAALDAIARMGARGYDAGLATTPAMFMSTVMPSFDMDGALMITASHLPFNRNGFKFFTADGGLDKEDIRKILESAAETELPAGEFADKRDREEIELMEAYAGYLRGLIINGLDGREDCLSEMHIAVDAGNGAAGFFATEVLAPLGADISGSRYLEPDGNFPNHEPNPENNEAVKAICEAVTQSNADLGIIFDTDGDRSAAVAPSGAPLVRNEIIAVAAALAADEHPQGSIVTDSITSSELGAFLDSKLGLKHYRYKRGYRNVIRKAEELCSAGEDAFLAIETSGHAAYSENYFLDDGAYLAVRIIITAARLKAKNRDITHLIKDMKSPAEALEIRYKIKREDFAEYAMSLLMDMEDWAERTEGLKLVRPNYEGVRVDFALEGHRGWFLMRKSLHDPVMPLNVESSTEGGAQFALDLIDGFIRNYNDVKR